ncbi:MAG: hypothetical protein NTZ78_07660 [Candidatus Aureabacteria bacterium]|nr:hypothetical protein [Candidatus Auribacterota bacterium]
MKTGARCCTIPVAFFSPVLILGLVVSFSLMGSISSSYGESSGPAAGSETKDFAMLASSAEAANAAEGAESAKKADEVVPDTTSPGQQTVEVVTPGGAPKEGPPVPTVDDIQTVLSQFSNEPTVQEIQEVAMRFAEVHPDLIEGWRKGAKYRALLPKFDFTVDTGRKFLSRYQTIDQRSTKNWTEDFTEDFTEMTPKTAFDIKDILRTKERDETDLTTRNLAGDDRFHTQDFTFKFEWDFGDFLFNPDQVRISDEARDLVELRNDVLEEVTQFYFQRRNSQIDLLLSPPDELRDRLRLELQLQEVTANIDYLTGGYLTQRLNDVKTGVTRKSNIIKRMFAI